MLRHRPEEPFKTVITDGKQKRKEFQTLSFDRERDSPDPFTPDLDDSLPIRPTSGSFPPTCICLFTLAFVV